MEQLLEITHLLRCLEEVEEESQKVGGVLHILCTSCLQCLTLLYATSSHWCHSSCHLQLKEYVLPAVAVGDRAIIIDFSPKGGPRDFSGVLEKDGSIRFLRDNNRWPRILE